MVWKGRRKGAVNSCRVRGCAPPSRGLTCASGHAGFLLNTSAASRVNLSPVTVREQVMSHTFVLSQLICVAAGPLLPAAIPIFQENRMRSRTTTAVHPIISCILASLSSASLVLGPVSLLCPRLTCVSLGLPLPQVHKPTPAPSGMPFTCTFALICFCRWCFSFTFLCVLSCF